MRTEYITRGQFVGVLLVVLASVRLHAEQFSMVGEKTLAPSAPSTVTVRGQGEVSAAPDRATVHLGVEAHATTAITVQETIASAMQKTMAQLRKLGVPDEAIQTTGLYLAPVYSQANPEAQTIDGYRASNVIRVRVDDHTQLGKVIDAAVLAGVNRLEGISFELKNDLTRRPRALKLAVAEAGSKAEAIALGLGVRLGSVENVSEEGAVVLPQQSMYA
jgi:uncharacterized protein